MFANDNRVVLTLDAGGTNFVFTAIQGLKPIGTPVTLPSNADNLDKCLSNIVEGFKTLKSSIDAEPVAISFAFPGPADYPNGIIGDLGNLPAFRAGVALGPMLQEIFGIPVFINNDGDLFAYGEAIAGILPQVNEELIKANSPRQFHNLLGVTLGTGFGAGFVCNGQLFIGDNSAGAEIWLTRSLLHPLCFAEEGVSIRAIQREYARQTNENAEYLTPKDIFDIAEGTKEGDPMAARFAFERLGLELGNALANAITLLDCLVVVGGGLSNAWKYIAPAVMAQLNGTLSSVSGATVDRLEIKAFNLDDSEQMAKFTKGNSQTVKVPMSSKTVTYDPLKRTGIGLSRLGTSNAVAIGAYAYALSKL